MKKKDINNIFIIFLFSHLAVWTLLPSILNNNLPLDTIEALAWASDLDWGYYKHPPFSAWSVEFFYQIFGNKDWAYYLLSQLFVVSSFVVIFKFSENFLNNKIYSLISVLLLEGIYFYNFTTTEFNVNVCQLPFWSLTVYYCWKSLNSNKTIDWILFGIFAAFGILSKYLFFYLLISIDIFFIYLIIKKKFKFNSLISILSFFIVLFPHLLWLINNDYTTIRYAFWRTGTIDSNFMDHIYNPLIFLIKQAGILIPFFIMIFFITKKFKVKINFFDKKIFFLISVTILPIILMFITSFLFGAKIKTMWMTPFYLFFGVLVVYILKDKIVLKKINCFFLVFLFFFILSPLVYYFSSYYSSSRTEIMGSNYPGKEVAKKVNTEWSKNFSNKIEVVVGHGWTNEWYAGNLSYNIKSRPKWKMKVDNKVIVGTVWIQKYNTIESCEGVLYQIIDLHDICMLGKK